MKKASLALVISAALALTACGSNKEAEEATTDTENAASSMYTTEAQQQSYALGARMGNFAKQQIEASDSLGLESDKAAISAGFNDAFGGKAVFTEQEIETFVKAYSVKFQAADQARTELTAAEDIAAGQAFLATNGAREGVTTTESGLQYEVLAEGEGASPSAEDTVKVHYHGTLIDGTVFDSSVERGEPIDFALNQVIKGWTEGVQLMKVGSKYRFTIPSELAYGARSTGKIKANSTLIFDVELIAIAPFTEG
jgi:FKBP-type peptidyl-prolyl cis-trans isomerase FkpA